MALKNKKQELKYLIYPRWKIIQSEIDKVELDHLKGKDKSEILSLKEEIDSQLKKNKVLGIVVLSIYILIYFSVISIVLSFLDLVGFLDNLISKLANSIGTPVLIVIVFLLNRIINNRHEQLSLLISKFYAKLESKKSK